MAQPPESTFTIAGFQIEVHFKGLAENNEVLASSLSISDKLRKGLGKEVAQD